MNASRRLVSNPDIDTRSKEDYDEKVKPDKPDYKLRNKIKNPPTSSEEHDFMTETESAERKAWNKGMNCIFKEKKVGGGGRGVNIQGLSATSYDNPQLQDQALHHPVDHSKGDDHPRVTGQSIIFTSYFRWYKS